CVAAVVIGAERCEGFACMVAAAIWLAWAGASVLVMGVGALAWWRLRRGPWALLIAGALAVQALTALWLAAGWLASRAAWLAPGAWPCRQRPGPLPPVSLAAGAAAGCPSPGAGRSARRGAPAGYAGVRAAHRHRWRGCAGSDRRGTARNRCRRSPPHRAGRHRRPRRHAGRPPPRRAVAGPGRLQRPPAPGRRRAPPA